MEILIQLGNFVKATRVAELVERVTSNPVSLTGLDGNLIKLSCDGGLSVNDDMVVVILDLLGLYKPTTMVVGDKLYSLCFTGRKPVRKRKLVVLDKHRNVKLIDLPMVDYSILTESKNPYSELKLNGLYVTSSMRIDDVFAYGIDVLSSNNTLLEDCLFYYAINPEREFKIRCDIIKGGLITI